MKHKKIRYGICCACTFLALGMLYSCGKRDTIPVMADIASSQPESSSSHDQKNLIKLEPSLTTKESEQPTLEGNTAPSAAGTAVSDVIGENKNKIERSKPEPTQKPAEVAAPVPVATPAPTPVPTCLTCGVTDHTVHPQPVATPAPVPTCSTCGTTEHTTHPQPTPKPENICGFCGGPRSVCGGIDYHHYHGNGSDKGVCPVCGFTFDVGAGGGLVPPPQTGPEMPAE